MMSLFLAILLGQALVRFGGDSCYLPGQLAAVSGLRDYPATSMELQFGKDIEPTFVGNKITPGGYVGYSFGFVRFSTTSEDFLGLPVWHTHLVGRTIDHSKKSLPQTDATVDYWVDMKGHIRKQYSLIDGPHARIEATGDYFPDHIQIWTTVAGKRTEQFLYPAHNEFDLLDAQFTPMVVDGKVLQREKSYLVLDLLRGAFEPRSNRVSGMFSGTELDTKFHGYAVDIEMPESKQTVCVSDKNDLIRVDLKDGKSIVITNVPTDRG